ncbi:S41 family peptidase [Paenibacillus sabinae]|uniref:Carboxyl-terminal protease n=1 Tax=Paenibacillus sabinae T27 TaxID=1268072 RepID=X5A3J7_9BACL|nr:S41 family peptidase [Paenibacillus sabinae]AHV98868.1 carboxyl-terminal protease [Paenibacillus sabinae T27]
MTFKKLTAAAAGTCLALSLVLSPAAMAADSTQASGQAAPDTDLIHEVMQYIEDYNLTGADKDALIRAAIDGMVESLNDPYTQYFSKDESKELQSQLALDYVGIGVQLVYSGNELYIEQIMPGSPAESAGLKRGDTILKINGVKISELESDTLSGKAGTKVTLLIQRGGVSKIYSVKRGEIEYPSVTGKIIGPQIAYIELNGFTEDSDEEFAAVLQKMRASGMKSMVLDLRNNGGGYMDTAYNIASQFIDKGIMMYTADNSGVLTPVTITNGSKIDVPVIILTNEYTASASEALTGALHDNDLATVVGTKSYGKARIQSLMELSDGGLLKLTTERYLTPDKVDFNHIGLTPDIEVKDDAAQIITALRLAGMKSIEAAGDNHILDVNGSAFSGNVGLVKQGGRVYASSRVLTALVNGTLTWDAKNKKVIVASGSGKTFGFSVSSKEALSRNGETFIALNTFTKKFPAVIWSINQAQNRLTITVKP